MINYLEAAASPGLAGPNPLDLQHVPALSRVAYAYGIICQFSSTDTSDDELLQSQAFQRSSLVLQRYQ
jgi:hypothetical protein